MTTFLATFIASLFDPIAVVLCLIAGAVIRRYLVAALVGGLIFIALLALLTTLPKVVPVLVARITAGAFLALVGCFFGRKFWPRREAA